ncbi:beta-lactamase family protein [Aureobasidium subglaciale]|nr:beta-lactamase family protein [Aureobasidium subglaciale]
MEAFCPLLSQRNVEDLMKEYHVPGISISFVKDREVTSTAYGVSNYDTNQPCTPSTLFDIASSSKSLTAACIALLVEDDDYPEITWTTPVSELLPEDFVMPTEEATKNVTVEDVLCHRTGMARHDLSYVGINAEQPDTPQSVTRALRHLPMASPEKTKYMLYSNAMYTVATYLIEVKTGLNFSDFLTQKLLKPLGMNATFVQPSSAISAGQKQSISHGHTFNKETQSYSIFPPLESPEAQGAGSIITSTPDYCLWISSLLSQTGPITSAISTTLTTPKILLPPEETNDLPPFSSPSLYCLGFETYFYRGHKVVIHDGCVDGFGSTHFLLPSRQFGAAIFGNGDEAFTVTGVIAKQLIDAALQVLKADRPDWLEWYRLKTKEDEDEYDIEKEAKELRENLFDENRSSVEPIALERYVGRYRNPGYGLFILELGDEGLFVDLNDRGFPSSIILEHVQTWREEGDVQALTIEDKEIEITKSAFIAHLTPSRGAYKEVLETQFEISRVGGDRKGEFKMGIRLENDLVEGELIWFTREKSRVE